MKGASADRRKKRRYIVAGVSALVDGEACPIADISATAVRLLRPYDLPMSRPAYTLVFTFDEGEEQRMFTVSATLVRYTETCFVLEYDPPPCRRGRRSFDRRIPWSRPGSRRFSIKAGAMDREILGIFLQSGPARKYDVSRFTRAIAANKDSEQLFLFRNKFLNHTILFKCIISSDYSRFASDKPISTLVYMPYDTKRPQEGGESFVFSPANFAGCCAHKLQTENVDPLAVEYDLEILKILDGLPTFSPLIVELAFERNNMTIPGAYLDLTPELRAKLRAQLKGRIRPLIVAVYNRSSVSVEKAVEEMTGKLFSLHDVREILPLVEALRLPPENAVGFLSSWIGITYFEYEYSMVENHLKHFAAWLSKASYLTEHISLRNKEYIDGMILNIKGRLSSDWKRICALSDEYREAYSDLVYSGEIVKFSKFLLKSKQAYWELGDFLGRFEQTAIAWRVFSASYHGKRIPPSIVIGLFTLLGKLHDSPQRLSPAEAEDEAAKSAGFPNFAPDLS
jgi:hypothetical protein